MQVPFVDLAAAYEAQKSEIDAAVQRVLASGWYILGEEVRLFEAEFAAFCGTEHAVGVASGTDALLLALKGFDIGPGDDVITTSHTAVATAAAITLCGARPVFVDVDPLSCTLNPDLLSGALTANSKAIIPVHLYGQMADMDPIMEFAGTHNLLVIEDCAQAHGTSSRGRLAGTIGQVGAFSFYPTKNLGAVGDGGAILCQDAGFAQRLRELRQYGWRQRYISDEVGINSRLDELQAAILRVKLQKLASDNEARQGLAALYDRLLEGLPLQRPYIRSGNRHVFHLYVVQTAQRDALRAYLGQRGIATAVHYPVPVHLQPAYKYLDYEFGSLTVSEHLADSVLSLPMYPQMSAAQAATVAEVVRDFYAVA